MQTFSEQKTVEVKIRDESLPRSEAIDMLLALSSPRLTARDFISERVRAECDRRLFDGEGHPALPLVRPSEKELRLNGVRETTGIAIDPERQVATAIEAFEANAFVLLVDDRQVEELDDLVDIGPDTVVTFLWLTPLVGG